MTQQLDLSRWKAVSNYSVVHAALLLSGHDPLKMELATSNSFGEDRPNGYDFVLLAIQAAIETSEVSAKIVRKQRLSPSEDAKENEIDWYKTSVAQADLVSWAQQYGISAPFKLEHSATLINERMLADCLDASGPFYSATLAAAVYAWNAIANDTMHSTKSPKTRIQNWLRKNSERFSNTQKQKLSTTAIDKIASIANWQPKGGAPSQTRKL